MRAGKTLDDMVAWLAGMGLQVGKSSVHRCLERIRAATPEPVPPPPLQPELAPADSDDELHQLRQFARGEMAGADWKQRHSAARLIIALRAEKRASSSRQVQAPEPAAAPPSDHVVFN